MKNQANLQIELEDWWKGPKIMHSGAKVASTFLKLCFSKFLRLVNKFHKGSGLVWRTFPLHLEWSLTHEHLLNEWINIPLQTTCAPKECCGSLVCIQKMIAGVIMLINMSVPNSAQCNSLTIYTILLAAWSIERMNGNEISWTWAWQPLALHGDRKCLPKSLGVAGTQDSWVLFLWFMGILERFVQPLNCGENWYLKKEDDFVPSSFLYIFPLAHSLLQEILDLQPSSEQVILWVVFIFIPFFFAYAVYTPGTL